MGPRGHYNTTRTLLAKTVQAMIIKKTFLANGCTVHGTRAMAVLCHGTRATAAEAGYVARLAEANVQVEAGWLGGTRTEALRGQQLETSEKQAWEATVSQASLP